MIIIPTFPIQNHAHKILYAYNTRIFVIIQYVCMHVAYIIYVQYTGTIHIVDTLIFIYIYIHRLPFVCCVSFSFSHSQFPIYFSKMHFQTDIFSKTKSLHNYKFCIKLYVLVRTPRYMQIKYTPKKNLNSVD